MSSDNSLAFQFSNLHHSGQALDKRWQILLHINGDFTVYIGDRLLYSEPYFTLIEFAVSASRWSSTAHSTGRDLVFESQESDTSGLVWLKRSGDGWTVGSAYQRHQEHTLFDLSEIITAIEDYVSRLHHRIQGKYGIDLYHFIHTEP